MYKNSGLMRRDNMRPGSVVDNSGTTRESAFSEFYLREVGLQVGRAFILVRSNEVANDIVHDAMIEVYRRWDELREPGAYLNRAVVNGCRDVGRRSQVQRRALLRLDRRPDQPSSQEPLDELLDDLPFRQRAAVVLRYYDDLSIPEIAHVLDCPQGSVGPWIDRALTAMRRRLSEGETR
jgi:RNA polymerase sigma factor (sigma-70 family)